MFTGLTPAILADILASVEPVELKGVALLRQCAPTSSFNPTAESFNPTADASAELVEATIEIIAYTRACEASLHRLIGLRSIPLTGIPIEEYSI